MANTLMTSMSIHPLASSPTRAPDDTTQGRAAVSPWTWMIVSCVLLGISGGIRYWREWRFSSLAAESATCPFRVADLPMVAGTWQASEGDSGQLDPEVAKVAGATEHTLRTYLDEKTGEQAGVLILYGLAADTYGHIPDVCYLAEDYRLVRGPIDRTITVPGVSKPVKYRWAIYSKRLGSINQYQECYYTFLHDDEWRPDMASRWKLFRYHPGLFKLQLTRMVTSLSENSEGPCEALLIQLVRQINDRASVGKTRLAEPAVTASASASASNNPAQVGDRR